MTLDQDPEGGLFGLASLAQEPLQQLAIGQPDRGPCGKQDLDLFAQRSRCGSAVHG